MHSQRPVQPLGSGFWFAVFTFDRVRRTGEGAFTGHTTYLLFPRVHEAFVVIVLPAQVISSIRTIVALAVANESAVTGGDKLQ
jgi:hypothetical protein